MNEHKLSLRELLERQFDRYVAPKQKTDNLADVTSETSPVPPVPESSVDIPVPETAESETPDAAAEEKWVTDMFETHCDRCAAKGFKSPAEWVRHLIMVDAALESHPLETIGYLATVYGVDVPKNMPTTPVVDWLIARHKERACARIDRLVEKAVSPEGVHQYPHYADVRQEMFRLIDGGMAHSIEEAYDQAIWLTQSVRDKLIHERADALLAERVHEAEQAKEASFCAQGKPCGAVSEEVPSIRALLERAFTKAGIYH